MTALLFQIKIRRTYDPSYKWKSGFVESTHLRWADSEEELRIKWDADHQPNAYWDPKFLDTLESVEGIDPEKFRQQRREYDQRMRSYVASAIQACCDLAILRPCVCLVSYSCPEHGEKCHGSHD